MRRMLFENLARRPLTEAAPAADDAALVELATNLDRAARRRTRAQPVDPGGGCRVVQRV